MDLNGFSSNWKWTLPNFDDQLDSAHVFLHRQLYAFPGGGDDVVYAAAVDGVKCVLRLLAGMRPATVDSDDDGYAVPTAVVVIDDDDDAVDGNDGYELLVARAYYGRCVANAMCVEVPLDGHDGVVHDPGMPLIKLVVYELQIEPFSYIFHRY